MKALVLVRNSNPENSFELQERPSLDPKPEEVCIEAEAFGLNYADIMARKGRYKDAPPLPSVIGYETAGRIIKVGSAVEGLEVGQRVAAFCRFGGYATEVLTNADAVVPIPEDMPVGEALALTVQYCTAWYCAEECMTLHPGDHVLVQAAAGGVGLALVQMAKRRGCTIYGTAGSPEKLEFLKKQGVHHPINYRKDDFVSKIREIRNGGGVDVVFDSLGGKEFKRGFKLLEPGGRIAGFGNASRSNGWANIFGDLKTLFGFGFYSPAFLLMQSRAIIGVNMLRVADSRAKVFKHCLEAVGKAASNGDFKPVIGATFKAEQLAEAHQYMEARKSIGKIVVEWT
ncbi:MAG TPA: alcohol dehydrogenase [Bacteroidetes bacterium]|nr:alcohol dehydrogenase [Bacteroidota bacterium]